jgi:hypothetical protein
VVVTADYSHLQPASRAFAEESNEARIRRIRTDRWITYGRAEAALAAMEDLLSFPKRTRMPNLLLVGPANNGKTMIIKKFWRTYPVLEASSSADGVARIPVLKVQMPPGPDELRFFGAILKEIGFPQGRSERLAKCQDTALRMMGETDVRLLIIDDVHNILSGSRVQQRRLLNLLRWLGNELQIPLVAVGTADALHAIHSDDQLANRFEPLGLPAWQNGDEYRHLLSTFEAVLPLRRPSQLVKTALAERILSAAAGILGEVVSILTRAAVRAVATGAEAISATILEETGFISPSQRRRVAV